MKAILCVGLMLLAPVCASAQTFHPHAPIAGRPGGGVERHDGGRDHGYRGYRGGGHGYSHGTLVSVGFRPGYYGGYGRGYGYYDGLGYYGYSPALTYDYGYSYPSAAANGLWLGALAGGIIGNNSGSLGHDAWRGAAWGAGVGWLLGAIADANRPRIAAPIVATTAAAPVQTIVAAPAATAAPIVAPAAAPATPMAAANALFGR